MASPKIAPVLPPSQPAARHPPTPPYKVLEETEKQWLFSEEELRRTPSVIDGMTIETERELRAKGVNFISQIGIMLKLPQLTLSTAAVFFNRFLMRNSLVDKPGRKALHHYVSRCQWLHMHGSDVVRNSAPEEQSMPSTKSLNIC